MECKILDKNNGNNERDKSAQKAGPDGIPGEVPYR